MIKKYIFIVAMLVLVSSAMAQIPHQLNYQGIARNASGEPISTHIITARLSIIDTYFARNGSPSNRVGAFWNVTSGVLQPFDKLYKPTRPTWLPDEVIIYPIPAVGVITINIQSFAVGKLMFQLVTQEGKILGTTSIDKNGYQLIEKTDLTRLSAGVYYIKLVLENLAGEKIKSGAFKIIKERK